MYATYMSSYEIFKVATCKIIVFSITEAREPLGTNEFPLVQS
jgi:hypothetical protein